MDTVAPVTEAPSGTQWTISHGAHRAVVVEVGGGLRAYGAGGIEAVDGFAEDEIPVGCAGQILAPWPNRIRDGQYTFGGESRRLPLTEPDRHNAIHGLVNWVRWRLVESSESSVTVEHDLVPQPGYPWPLRLRTVWSVDERGLRAEHQVTNTGHRACPFGLGVHPYVYVPGVPVNNLTLKLAARNRLLTDARLLPIGAARVAGTEFDFSEGRKIGSTILDTAFGDVADVASGSEVTVTSPDGRGVAVWADSAFTWWQVYSSDSLPPARLRRSVAVEPMTCPPDAFRSGRDVYVIEPGAQWQGAWGIRPMGAY